LAQKHDVLHPGLVGYEHAVELGVEHGVPLSGADTGHAPVHGLFTRHAPPTHTL
jgi:hypothetical protein